MVGLRVFLGQNVTLERSPRPTFYHYCPDDAMQHVFVLFCCSTTERKEEKLKFNSKKKTINTTAVICTTVDSSR